MTKKKKSCVDPNPLRVERQDPDNVPRLQTRERYALEIAAYVFKVPIMTAADDKFCDNFANFRKKIRYNIS